MSGFTVIQTIRKRIEPTADRVHLGWRRAADFCQAIRSCELIEMLLEYRDGALNRRRAKSKNPKKERPSHRKVTNERLLDLVCSMRSELLAARLITVPEFEWLCSPSNPQRLDTYREILRQMDELKHQLRGLQEKHLGPKASIWDGDLSSLTDKQLATMTDRLLHAVYGDDRQAIAAAKRQMMIEADAVVIRGRSNGG